MALIAPIFLNKRAAHRNYRLDDTASNKDINYITLLHLILWGTFKFSAKNSIGFCYWEIMSLIAIYSIFTQINELHYKLPSYKCTTPHHLTQVQCGITASTYCSYSKGYEEDARIKFWIIYTATGFGKITGTFLLFQQSSFSLTLSPHTFHVTWF